MKRYLPVILVLVLLTGCSGAASPAPEVLTEPPALTVRCGEASAEALRGAASWSYDNGDGTQTAFEADSLHPLDEAARDLTPCLALPDVSGPLEATLEWDPAPDTVTVRCWSDVLWGDTSASAEEIAVKDLTIVLRESGYVYEVVAGWSSEETWGGTASYSFHAGPAA